MSMAHINYTQLEYYTEVGHKMSPVSNYRSQPHPKGTQLSTLPAIAQICFKKLSIFHSIILLSSTNYSIKSLLFYHLKHKYQHSIHYILCCHTVDTSAQTYRCSLWSSLTISTQEQGRCNRDENNIKKYS